MNQNMLFEAGLGLNSPWKVAGSGLEDGGESLAIHQTEDLRTNASTGVHGSTPSREPARDSNA
jgi:hypothetical protein